MAERVSSHRHMTAYPRLMTCNFIIINRNNNNNDDNNNNNKNNNDDDDVDDDNDVRATCMAMVYACMAHQIPVKKKQWTEEMLLRSCQCLRREQVPQTSSGKAR